MQASDFMKFRQGISHQGNRQRMFLLSQRKRYARNTLKNSTPVYELNVTATSFPDGAGETSVSSRALNSEEGEFAEWVLLDGVRILFCFKVPDKNSGTIFAIDASNLYEHWIAQPIQG